MYCSYGLKFIQVSPSENFPKSSHTSFLVELQKTIQEAISQHLSAGLMHKELQRYALQDNEFYQRNCLVVCALGSICFPFFST